MKASSENTSNAHLIEDLASPNLQLNHDRERINLLILQLLRRYIAEFNRNNRGESSNLSFGANCLSDIASTAAIVREIIFSPKQITPAEDTFVGHDFGAGSGVLTLAVAIAGRRLGYSSEKIHVTGYDMPGQNTTPVNRTLYTFLSPDRYSNVTVSTGDILDPGLHKTLPHPRIWVSETITSIMPGIVIEGSRVRRAYDRRSNVVVKGFQAADPFVDVLATASECHPSLVADVRSGRIWVWPDPINGKLLVENNLAIISLETSEDPKKRFLWEIGIDFLDKKVRQTSSSRFPKPEDRLLDQLGHQ